MTLTFVIMVVLTLVLALWVLLGSEVHHRTELNLDTFELESVRARRWLRWNLARAVFVRPTHLSTPAKTAAPGGAGVSGARVLVDATLPGLRGCHGVGRHLVQLMALRGDGNGFSAWARQHPAETDRLMRAFAAAVATRGAETAAQKLRELLVAGAVNDHATFAADIDAHLP